MFHWGDSFDKFMLISLTVKKKAIVDYGLVVILGP